MLLPSLPWLYLLAYFPFFFTHCHPPWFRLVCLPTLASSKHSQRFNVRGRERMRDSEREREEQVPGCFVGNTVKRSTVHGAPSAEHTSKPVLHLYCQHLGEERRGEERGWSSLWAALGLYPLPLLSMFALSSPLTLPNCLCARRITTLFYFHPIPVSFILLTSHFLLVYSAFSSLFDFN